MKARIVLNGLIILMCLSAGAVQAQKVACVGDSITYGSGIGNREKKLMTSASMTALYCRNMDLH